MMRSKPCGPVATSPSQVLLPDDPQFDPIMGVRVRDAGASLAIVPGLGDTFEPICGVASVPLLKKLPSYAR